MTKKRFTKGEWTNCRYDICEILKDEEYYCTVATDDVDLIINVLEENEELKQSNERLLKMLDNVANYMQKQNKYMPIDDFVEWWNGIATKGLDFE